MILKHINSLQKNCHGKTILDYVLSTQNSYYLFSFLMRDPSKIAQIRQPKQFMMLKNSLLVDFLNKNLIDIQLDFIETSNDLDSSNLQNLFYFFEEMQIFNSEQKEENKYIRSLFEDILNEQTDKFDGINPLKSPRKHFLIGIMMSYWTCEANIEKLSTFGSRTSRHFMFELVNLIIKKEENKFFEELKNSMKNFEENLKDIYNIESTYDNSHQKDSKTEIFHFIEKYSANFFFVILYAAIKTNQSKIIKKIFKYHNFLIICPTFPANMKVERIHKYTALKFIENKYEIGRDNIPKSWITKDVLEEFLDSRVTSQGELYKVDCRFMLPYYNHGTNIKSSNEVNDDLIFNEDQETMKYIINDHKLKSLVSHPVLEMIIRAKIKKYSRILNCNFWGFILGYILPTLLLTFFDHNGWIFLLNIIRIITISIRETIQHTVFKNENPFNFKEFMIVIGLIIIPLIQLPVGLMSLTLASEYLMKIFEVFNIIIMIGATADMLSKDKYSIYFKSFVVIFKMIINVLISFLPFFIGFLTLGLIVFSIREAYLVESIFIYSGTYKVLSESVTNIIQVIFIILILMLLVTKANLITSIAVNDIRKIMDHSKETKLIYNAKQYVYLSKKIRIFYILNE